MPSLDSCDPVAPSSSPPSLRLLTVGACLVTAMLVTVWLGSCTRPGPPYSPRKALSSFRIEAGFRIELFAAEPDIVDPVAMEFDEDGRIFVVEMPGDPLDLKPTGFAILV